VGCGRSAPKSELARLALTGAPSAGAGAMLVVDRAQRMPGRGAYVCSDACLARARRRGGLQRAFRRPVSIDAQTVESVG
jgi:predicted RNA-binding protein YlxR (DUF448 family)